jgi:hypothetical protein
MRTVLLLVSLVAVTARADDEDPYPYRFGVDLLDGMVGFEHTAALRPPAGLRSARVTPAPAAVTMLDTGTQFIFWLNGFLIGYETEGFSGRQHGSEWGGIIGYAMTGRIVGGRLELHVGGRDMQLGGLSSSDLYVQPRAVLGLHWPGFGGFYGAVYVGADLRPTAGFAAGGYLAMQVGRW